MPETPPKFKRMTCQEFNVALARHQLSQGSFCRLSGVSRKKVMQWVEGSEDIPPWVPVFFAAAEVPGALDAALQESESRLLN